MTSGNRYYHRYACSVCGRSDVRLYRPECEWLRVERIRCNAHMTLNEEWRPLVVDKDGHGVWHGVRSGRPDEWLALGDADATGPTWRDAGQDALGYRSVRTPMSERAERYALRLKGVHCTTRGGFVWYDTRWDRLPNDVLRAWANDMVALEDAVLAAGMRWVMPEVVIGDSGMPEARWPTHGAPGRKMVARWRFDLADVVYQYSQVSADTIE